MRKIDLQEPKTLLNQKEKQKPFPIFLFPFYFILLILLMIGESITAQVIIKEKVEITPQVLKAPDSPSQQQHTIMFNMQWDKPNREGLLRTVWLPCKDNLMAGWSTGGNLSLSIDNAQPGGYMFQVKVNLDVYEVSNVNYTIFLDGILARSGSVSLTGSSWDIPYYNINYSPPLISNYSISYQNKANMCYLDSKNISIYQTNGCPTVVSWNPSTEQVTLTIESGSEFVSFYDQTNNKLGDNFTGLFTEASSLLIKQDSLYFGSENKSLILSCDWAGIIHKDSSADIVSINPDDLTISLNTYTNDTIYSGEIISCDISFGENAGCSALLPQDQTYSVEITNGQNNGNLINPMSGEEVKKIDAMDHWHGYAGFDYIADGNSCDSLDSIIIKVGTSFLGNKSSEKVIYIKPPPLKVIIDPPLLTAGDTVDIIIKKRNPDGSLEDFPPNQEFEIAKLEGCLFGDILVGDSLDYYFADAKQPVRFVVADSLVSDSGVVKLRVGLVENYESINQKYNGKKLRAGKYIEQGKEEWRLELEKLFAEKRNKTQKLMSNDLSSSCYIGYFITETCWQGVVPIGKPELEILLGETKYYQARYNEGKLVIDELSGPILWNGGLSEDVWGNTPVSIVEGGDKLGVYWEKEKPIWNGNTNLGILPRGLIRLVGRYWEEGKTYKVKLTAKTQNGDEVSIVVEVKKPSKLGDNIAIVKDVNTLDLNIDELCIKWGGKLGIPPQFIKGHMRRETSSHYLFYPTYLYEPWTTQFKAFKDDESLFSNPFFVPENATTFNPPTPSHSNVKDYHYPTSPVSVWDMIENYSTIVYSSPPGGWRKYGERQATQHASKENGVLYFYGVYKTPQNKYDELKRAADKKYDVKKNPSNEPLANNEARENFIKFFKDEWNGGISSNKKGLKNIKAQTRIAASYGLLQLMYPTAIGGTVNYPVNSENLPEELLETENIKWAFNHLTYFINNAINTQTNKDGNWQEGLEDTYLNRVWKRWNQWKVGYPKEVLGFSNNYKPAK